MGASLPVDREPTAGRDAGASEGRGARVCVFDGASRIARSPCRYSLKPPCGAVSLGGQWMLFACVAVLVLVRDTQVFGWSGQGAGAAAAVVTGAVD